MRISEDKVQRGVSLGVILLRCLFQVAGNGDPETISWQDSSRRGRRPQRKRHEVAPLTVNSGELTRASRKGELSRKGPCRFLPQTMSDHMIWSSGYQPPSGGVGPSVGDVGLIPKEGGVYSMPQVLKLDNLPMYIRT